MDNNSGASWRVWSEVGGPKWVRGISEEDGLEQVRQDHLAATAHPTRGAAAQFRRYSGTIWKTQKYFKGITFL